MIETWEICLLANFLYPYTRFDSLFFLKVYVFPRINVANGKREENLRERERKLRKKIQPYLKFIVM